MEKAQELQKANDEITRELEANRLGAKQQQMVEANRGDLDGVLGSQVNYREISFEGTLGSGTFGDCYKGRLYDRPVAVKKVREEPLNRHASVRTSQN